MSVAIMDADLANYTLVPWNLECMKLSAYYKKQNEIVVLAPDFIPERYAQFIYRKDYNDGIYPINLLTTPNVSYGGLAFSNNKYIPLDETIEKMRPDASLYNKMEHTIKGPNGTKSRKAIFDQMLAAEHVRLSLDGKTVWPQFDKQLKNISVARHFIVHDYNLGEIEGAFDTIQYVLKHARGGKSPTKFGTKFPIHAATGEDLIKWSSLNTNATFFGLHYDGVMDDDTFNEWTGHCFQKPVYSQMEYHVTSNSYTEDEFIKFYLPKLFRQVIISRSYYLFFSLIYDEGFFKDKRWEDVLKLINFYHISFSSRPQASFLSKVGEDTMYDFAVHCKQDPTLFHYGPSSFNIQKIREIFAFVHEENPDLFKDFYELNAIKLGGKINGTF